MAKGKRRGELKEMIAEAILMIGGAIMFLGWLLGLAILIYMI